MQEDAERIANGVITLGDFAVELGLDKSGARKSIIAMSKRHGRNFLQRGRVRDNQPGWVLSREDADMIMALRQQSGFVPRTKENSGSAITAPIGRPTVYVLDLHGSRLKIGYSDAFASRMTSHRTLVPDLSILRQWALPQAYEVVMLDIARNFSGLREIGPEVFEYSDGAVRAEFTASLDVLVALVGANALHEDVL